MPMTPEDVRTKTFNPSRLGRKGYDEMEVRGFLAEVATELDGLVVARDEATSRLQATQQALIAAQPRAGAGAEEPAAEVPDVEVSDVAARAARVLALAERTAQEHVSQAQAEAEQLLRAARERAETTDRETDEHRREVIGAVETQRSELEARIESLRSFEREYRSRLGAYLQQQLDELHAGGNGPAGGGVLTDGSLDLRRAEEAPSPG